jgi:hypothetical protein
MLDGVITKLEIISRGGGMTLPCIDSVSGAPNDEEHKKMSSDEDVVDIRSTVSEIHTFHNSVGSYN